MIQAYSFKLIEKRKVCNLVSFRYLKSEVQRFTPAKKKKKKKKNLCELDFRKIYKPYFFSSSPFYSIPRSME